MYPNLSLLAGILAVNQVLASQTPLFPPSSSESDSYTLKWPVKKVAIIGAGPGGLLNYREFTQAGFDVHLFERDYIPTGNWHYTEETPVDAAIPNADISIADFTPSLPPKGVQLPYEEEYHGVESRELRRAHRGPKPIWATLHSNAPAPIQQFTEIPWPKGTEWELPHANLGKYVRAFASFHGINSNDDNPRLSFNTRVELVEKRYNDDGEEAGWTLTLKQIIRTGEDSTKAVWYTQDFDAVVIATGRYNAPNVPNIPGLADWAERFPNQLRHSRQYRRPEPYADKTVLIIGAANSGDEIARDVNPHVKRIYQSVRPDNSTRPHFLLKTFLRRVPSNVTLVPEIKRFLPPASRIEDSQVELNNGTIITGIDTVLFATGFRYTFPFLPQYINSSTTSTDDASSAHPRPIVTDGTHLRSLWLDIFYIEEPTLGFVNMNIGSPQSFTYAEYIAVALTKVWAGKALLPSASELWRQQRERVEELGGYGRHFQFVGAEKTDQIFRFFLGWLNDAAVRYGGRQIDALNPANAGYSEIWSKARFGTNILEARPDNFTALGLGDAYGAFAYTSHSQDRMSDADLISLYNDLY